jgi:hypothetical protein
LRRFRSGSRHPCSAPEGQIPAQVPAILRQNGFRPHGVVGDGNLLPARHVDVVDVYRAGRVLHIDCGHPVIGTQADDGAANPHSSLGRGDSEPGRVLFHDFACDDAGNTLQQMDVVNGFCAVVRKIAQVHGGIRADVEGAVVVEKNTHPTCGVGFDAVGHLDRGMYFQEFRPPVPHHGRAGDKDDDLTDIRRPGW